MVRFEGSKKKRKNPKKLKGVLRHDDESEPPLSGSFSLFPGDAACLANQLPGVPLACVG